MADQVVRIHRVDGSWSLTNKKKCTRAWTFLFLHHLVAVSGAARQRIEDAFGTKDYTSPYFSADNVDNNECSASGLSNQDEGIKNACKGCKKTYGAKQSLSTHVRSHGDEFFCNWYYGIFNPLKWMQEYYPLVHTQQHLDAPLLRMNQGLVITRLLSK